MFIPNITDYTNDVLGGDAFLFRIRINPKYAKDRGLHAHEEFHVLQFWVLFLVSELLVYTTFKIFHYDINIAFVAFLAGIFTHSIIYTVSKRYRFWSEIKAYRIQMKYSPHHVDKFVELILEKKKYNFNRKKVTPERVKRLLNE